MRTPTLLASLVVVGLCACRPTEETAVAQPAGASAPTDVSERISVLDVRQWVGFLADDAQQGRSPGTVADERVRGFVAERMQAFGLEPAGSEGFFQPFEVTDGVRLRAGEHSRLAMGEHEIAHHLVPFSQDTFRSGAVAAKLVFVGHGISGEKAGTGDYAGLENRVKGNIVVARAGGPSGPAGPHVASSALRPQTKLISARDLGAVGFILWDPQTDIGLPNHGHVADLQLPAVFVGTAGTPELLAAMGAKGKEPNRLKPGQQGRGKVTIQTPVEPIVLRTANVVGRLRGTDGFAQQIIVGAHLDHLGMGNASSLAPGEPAIHNGADDNASGVAAMLGVAKAYAAREPGDRTRDVLFVAFAAEEMGLLGSKHMVEAMSERERERTLAMINFDMVGRLGDELIVNGSGTAAEWEKILTESAAGLKLSFVPDGYGPSDHATFYAAQVPVLHFFTGAHDDYHRPTDDVEKINFEGAARVGAFALGVVDRLDAPATKLSYVKTEKKSASRGAFKVSLGTMPDYAADVDGLKLAGVSGGGAAEQAGLRKGDVIVEIGDRKVHGIDDFMASFGVLEPGQPTIFVILRDGERREIEVVPAAPRPH